MAEALNRAVHDRLDLVDQIAERGDPGALLPMARAELHRLAESWRHLLTAHQPDADGRCNTCPPGIRRRRWPCQIWVTAHDHLIGDALSARHDTSAPPEGGPFRATGPAEPRTVPLPAVVVQRVEVSGAAPQAAEPPTITELTLPPANRPVEPSTPPARLETDSRRIHRAAVVGRTPVLPRRRITRARTNPNPPPSVGS